MCRELSIDESKRIRNNVLKELDKYSLRKNGYWYPLCNIKDGIKCISFFRDDISDELWKDIYYILKSEGIRHIYEIQENVDRVRRCHLDGYFFDHDTDGYDMLFMSECYWFDDNHKCLIYTSHEKTISFSGNIVDRILSHNKLKRIVKEMYYQKNIVGK